MLEIRNLNQSYREPGLGVQFSLKIPFLKLKDEEVMFLMGPNGSGKTTFISIIQGLIKPDAGEILIFNTKDEEIINLEKLNQKDRSRYLSIVPQDIDDILVGEMTVREHILARLIRIKDVKYFFPKKRNRNLVTQVLLKHPFLKKVIDQNVNTLSGGERQLLVILLSSLTNPSLLLFDEFTASLDPEMSLRMLDNAVRTARDKRKCSIFVTHRITEALRWADRIVLIDNGIFLHDIRKGSNEWQYDYLRNIFTELYYNKHG